MDLYYSVVKMVYGLHHFAQSRRQLKLQGEQSLKAEACSDVQNRSKACVGVVNTGCERRKLQRLSERPTHVF